MISAVGFNTSQLSITGGKLLLWVWIFYFCHNLICEIKQVFFLGCWANIHCFQLLKWDKKKFFFVFYDLLIVVNIIQSLKSLKEMPRDWKYLDAAFFPISSNSRVTFSDALCETLWLPFFCFSLPLMDYFGHSVFITGREKGQEDHSIFYISRYRSTEARQRTRHYFWRRPSENVTL